LDPPFSSVIKESMLTPWQSHNNLDLPKFL
jgi:hypothetical protein